MRFNISLCQNKEMFIPTIGKICFEVVNVPVRWPQEWMFEIRPIDNKPLPVELTLKVRDVEAIINNDDYCFTCDTFKSKLGGIVKLGWNKDIPVVRFNFTDDLVPVRYGLRIKDLHLVMDISWSTGY